MNIWAIKVTAFIGIVTTFAILFILAALIRGWVLSFLWDWFLVPLGLPAIGFWHSVGICLMVAFLTYHYYNFQRSQPNLNEALIYVFSPLAVLGIGWVIHFLM